MEQVKLPPQSQPATKKTAKKKPAAKKTAKKKATSSSFELSDAAFDVELSASVIKI